MPYLTRDAIYAVDDRVFRDVDVPEWGGTVRVSSLSGRDRDAWEASMQEVRGEQAGNVRAKLVARAIVDEDGKRLFTDLDIKALGDKNAAALNRVFNAAAELSGLGASAVADAEGNSEPDPGDDSSSDSPVTSDVPASENSSTE